MTNHPLIVVYLFLFFLASFPLYVYASDIAAIMGMDIPPYRETVRGFKSVVGKDIEEYVLNSNRVPSITGDNPKAIFAIGRTALETVRDRFKNTPVVFAFVLNPDRVLKGCGWCKTYMKGIAMNPPPEREFEVLLQVVPEVRRIGVVYDPSKTGKIVEEARDAARRLGIDLVARKVNRRGGTIDAISRMKGKVDALYMVPDTTAISPESLEYMLLFSFREGIPIIGLSDKYVKKGALLALSFDPEDIGRQAGDMVNRLTSLSGIGTIPERTPPRRFILSINLKVADKMGFKVPEKIIRMAGRVYR